MIFLWSPLFGNGHFFSIVDDPVQLTPTKWLKMGG
jgi:hypothetical protein